VRKLTAAGMGLLAIGVALTGCASYTEVYGRILDKQEEEVHSLVLVGKVMVPQTTTRRYLEVEYQLDGEVVHEEFSVRASTYEGCEVGDYILREESGTISCQEKSWR